MTDHIDTAQEREKLTGRWRVYKSILGDFFGIEIEGDNDAEPILPPQRVSREILGDCVREYNRLLDALDAERAEVARLKGQRDTFARSFRDSCRAQNALVDRAEKAEAERDHWMRAARYAGVCMTCQSPRGAPEPYGCTDCLNTGWSGEYHNGMADAQAERDQALARLAAVKRETKCPRCGSDGGFGCYECIPSDDAEAALQRVVDAAVRAERERCAEALADLLTAYAACNGEDHPAYRRARAALNEENDHD